MKKLLHAIKTTFMSLLAVVMLYIFAATMFDLPLLEYLDYFKKQEEIIVEHGLPMDPDPEDVLAEEDLGSTE